MKKDRGFTLIEVILAMIIGILVMSSAYYIYSIRDRDTKASLTAVAAQTLLDDADYLTAHMSDYSVDPGGLGARAITVQDVMTGRADNVPNSFSQDAPGGSLFNVYNGIVFMDSGPSSPASTVNDTVRLVLTRVPSEACPRILSLMAPYVYDMRVGPAGDTTLVAMSPVKTAESYGRFETRMGQASSLCAEARTLNMEFRRLKKLNYTALRPTPFGPLSPAQATALQEAYDRHESALQAKEDAQVALGLD